MADEIKADYEQLEQVANKFSSQSEEIQQMLQQVKNGMEKLEPDWIGRGSDAFSERCKARFYLPCSDYNRL
ncbi:MAG: WXG100 family type VII secretion target [Anaerolineales bacterium]|nr:WXG100 family type VII secretion target [Anaerolineales bacterium]